MTGEERVPAVPAAVLDAGVDAVMTTDDYAHQRRPIMGVERFREFNLPGLERQCQATRDFGGYPAAV